MCFRHWGSFFRGTHGHDEETSAGSKVEAKSPSATAGSSDGGGSSGSEREASAAGEGKGLPTALELEVIFCSCLACAHLPCATVQDASFWSVVIAQYSALAVPCLSVLAHQVRARAACRASHCCLCLRVCVVLGGAVV